MNVITRRDLVKGIAAGAPLAAILADPMLARAVAAGLETVTITTEGGRAVKGTLAMPAGTPAAGMLLVHEWWGLNDQIKTMAAEFAREGYIALALDLYEGKVAGDAADARKYVGAVDQGAASDTAKSWVKWLKAHTKGTGKAGTVGWCFGGGWSLMASILEPVDATVVFYGRVNRPASELKNLKGPVLGHFGTLDRSINKEMVGEFEAAMKEAGKTYTSHWYEANHGFANPTGTRYDAEDTKLAWKRTVAFLKTNL